LRDSAANRFYTIHGFALAEQTEFDNHYDEPQAPELDNHCERASTTLG
jgi:hypothetical protein